MYAITVAQPGGPDVLLWKQVRDPQPGPGEVVIDVAAAGVNRADILQRQGLYPPPPGASPYLGLECSGIIRAVGEQVMGWKAGDRVCALLSGGGYAEQVVVPAEHLLEVPANLSLAEAAALPEALCTSWLNLVDIARIRQNSTILIHGGSGGIGTMAIQVAVALGAKVFATASTAKHQRCLALGASRVIDYHHDDFVHICAEETGGNGVDVILDIIGAAYFQQNLHTLANGGHLLCIGLQGGRHTDLDLGQVLSKNLTISGSTLRARSLADKARLIAEVHGAIWPLVSAGFISPVVDQAVAMPDARQAHHLMEQQGITGKIVLVR